MSCLATHEGAHAHCIFLLAVSGRVEDRASACLRHAMELENRTQVLGTFTGNMTEAMHAFREKREPNWKPL